MQPGDWFHAGVLAVVGVLLGSAALNFLQLAIRGAWMLMLITALFFAAMFLIVMLTDKLYSVFLGPGIRPAPGGNAGERKPLLRILSLPAGMLVGAFMGLLGWDRVLLAALP